MFEESTIKILKKVSVNRRAFMGQAIALGLTESTASTLLAKNAQAVPRKGGTLRFGSADGSTTDSLAPDLLNSATAYLLSWSIRNSLCEVTHSGELVPELAESWDVSPDAKTWVFRLRKGVEFHNGKEFEADDVIYSMNLHRGESSKSAAKTLLASVADVAKEDKYTVKFTLSQSNSQFNYQLSTYRLCIVPNGGDTSDQHIGTGAFILERYQPGVLAYARRNQNYWKEGRGHFDALEVTVVTDASARLLALQSGDLDAINRCDLKAVAMLAQNPSLQIMEVTGNMHYTLPMDTRLPPYKDNNVRLALKYAIDREEVVKKILLGHGRPANDHPIGPANLCFAADLPQHTYDPERARYHLKEAGLNSLDVELSVSDAAFEGAVDLGTLYSAQAAKCGINIKVNKTPRDAYWDNVWMKAPWCASYYNGGTVEDYIFSLVYASDASWNESHWKSERFDTLLKQARGELNDSRRCDMYREMQKIVRDEGGSVIPVYGNYVDAANSRVKLDKLAANFEMDGLRAPERWWFE